MNDVAQLSLDFDQQIEQHARNIERIQRDAVFEIGRELAGAQELFRYSKAEGGFTGWLERRLPQMSERSAYNAINIYQNVDPKMFAKFANIPSPGALVEVAKAAPDVQALIAERVEAGEIFTAAKVKEIRAEAAAEAVTAARKQIAELERRLASKDEDTEALQAEVDELTDAIKSHEAEIEKYQRSLPSPKEAEKQAAKQDGVVLGRDGKFHSGASKLQKELVGDYLTVWAHASALANRKERPLAERVAAGCSPQHRKQLRSFLTDSIAYLTSIMEAVDAAPQDQA